MENWDWLDDGDDGLQRESHDEDQEVYGSVHHDDWFLLCLHLNLDNMCHCLESEDHLK